VITASRRALLLSAVALMLASCDPGTPLGPSAGAPSPPPPSAGAPPSGSNPSVEPSPPVVAGQTETAWGRIWDSVPDAFPTYPGSTPANEAASGPASATLAVQGADARTIAGWMQSNLEQATYSTEALTGPFEDGSYVLESTGTAPGCRVRVSIAPLGNLTTVTVLYGASCPNP
jgi:hypothetical protein